MTTELPTIKTSDSSSDFIDAAYAEGITPIIVNKVGQVTIRMGFPATAGLVKQFVILSRAANCNLRRPPRAVRMPGTSRADANHFHNQGNRYVCLEYV
mgnify:CR=1 FL=1